MAPKVQVSISAKDVASKDIKKVSSSLKTLKKNTNSSNIFMKNFSTTMNTVRNNSIRLVKSLGKFGLVGAITGVGVSIGALSKSIKESSSLEMYSKQFEVLTGNVITAQSTIDNLRNFAAKTPLSFSDLTDVSVQLMGAGVSSDELMSKLKMLGDVSMGNSDKLQSMANAYSKVKSTGKASLEYLNIFMERGVPIVQTMAENYNTTTKEMFNMISQGKVGLPEVEGALKSLTTEGGLFNNMMAKTSETLTGKISTFKDNITAAFANFGNKILPDVKFALDSISTSFNNLLENKEFNNFITKAVKFSSWLFQQLAALPLYFNFIKNVFKIVMNQVILEFENLKNSLNNVPIINFFVNIIGDTYEAIKKGFTTGNWSDVFGVSMDIIDAGMKIGLTFIGAKMAVEAIKPLLYNSLLKSGFIAPGAGTIAFASLAIGLKLFNVAKEGDYKKLIADLVAGLIAGFATFGITGNITAGVFVASIAINFELGDKSLKLFDWIGEKLSDFNKGKTQIVIETVSENLSGWETSRDKKKISKLNEDSRYDYTNPNNDVFTNKNIAESLATQYLNTTNLGEELLKGLEIGLKDTAAIEKLVEKDCYTIINQFKKIFDINSPSKKTIYMGQMLNQGLVVGLSKYDGVKSQMVKVGTDTLAAFNKSMEIHSPSNKTKWSGQMLLEGLLAGIGDGKLQEQIQNEFKLLVEGLNDLGKVNVEATVDSIINSGNGSSSENEEKKSNSSILDKLKSNISGFFNKTSLSSLVQFKENLDDSGNALGTYTALLNYGNIIFDGFMSILGPATDQILKPVFGMLNTIGQFLGKLLLPVFEALAIVTEKLAQGFVWFYNNVIKHIGNGIITVMNLLANGIIGIMNSVISAINKIPFVNIDKISYRSNSAGYLSDISLESLNQTGSQYTGSSSGTSSSTSQQSYEINIYQTIEGNVIGDGGLSSVGEFITQALEAYIGSGGKVNFIKA